jgi:hypothetical protein
MATLNIMTTNNRGFNEMFRWVLDVMLGVVLQIIVTLRMLSGVMLSVAMASVVFSSVIILNVVLPRISKK